jgi:uncharacterized protein (TIGR02271 family)
MKNRGLNPNMDRLSSLRDLEVAGDSPDVRGWNVATLNDRPVGRVEDLIVDTREMKARYLLVDLSTGDGEPDRSPSTREERVLVPLDRAHIDESEHLVRLDVVTATALPRFSGTIGDDYDERYRRTAPPASSTPSGDPSRREDAPRMTRSTEELKIGRRQVSAGEVVVSKEVETEHVRQPVQRMREDVEIERRPVSQPSADIGPDEIRVPISEEEIVVEKRPVIKEEVVIRKVTRPETVEVEEDIRKERIVVDRSRETAPDRDPRQKRGR